MNKKQMALTVVYFGVSLAALSYGFGMEWQKALAVCIGIVLGAALFIGYLKLMDHWE